MESRSLSDPEQWVDRHGHYLFRCALLRVRDPRLAEDIVQETLLAALQSRERFAGISSERSWLVGILKHKVVDYFRKNSREGLSDEMEQPFNKSEQAFDHMGRWRGEAAAPKEWTEDPGVILERKEFWEVLARCLAELPPRMARAFSLREIDGISSEEICNVLKISPTNLWVILHRARSRLRRCLEVNCMGLRAL